MVEAKKTAATPGKGVEILAPAGSLEVFEAAVRAGADAVYIGAPELNARNLARHFTDTEIAAMIDHGHSHGVRVYAALNSLVKDSELAGAARVLHLLERLEVDGIILQDLGVYRLAREHFPQLRLHASTLMGTHNSLAAARFRRMGFKRVVLARECTLAEIEAIHRQVEVELEAFVHGAMCFSISGLCMFSSYLGGKSGLRGRCVQPCRRRYGLDGGRGGYLFSMNDLQGLELVPALRQAGIVSLKIEGRMRSVQYVENVVRAYRLLLDQPASQPLLRQAEELLEAAMGRRTTAGFFRNPAPVDIVSPGHSGNIGIFLGKLAAVAGQSATLELRAGLAVGDRLRLHQEKSGERQPFTLKAMTLAGRQVSAAGKGDEVTIELPAAATVHDALYKVDSAGRREAATTLDPQRFAPLVARIDKAFARHAAARVGAAPPPRPAARKATGPRRHPLEVLPWYLKTDTPAILDQKFSHPAAGLMVVLHPGSSRQFFSGRRRLDPRTTVVCLPPVIYEREIGFFRKQIEQLRKGGFRRFQIGHLGQLELFDGNRRQLELFGDSSLNVMNGMAAEVCREAGIRHLQAVMECDAATLRDLLARGKGREMKIGFTVYGHVPLFVSRVPLARALYGRTITSPKGEQLRILQRFGLTVVTDAHPASLLHKAAELRDAGVDYLVVDMAWTDNARREMEALTGRRKRPTGSFNYDSGLA